ncbi:MAG: hypothetical protein ACREOH_02005 [Candidatus Entotheonellia bacterium]
MTISGAFMEEISQALNVDRETLIAQGIASLLKDRKRRLMLERLQRLAHYALPSREALEQAVQAGKVAEHPAWEDVITLENLEGEIARIDGYLSRL